MTVEEIVEHIRSFYKENEYEPTETELNTLATMQPVLVKEEFGVCPECGRLSAIYKIKWEESDTRYWYGCRSCMTRQAFGLYSGIRLSRIVSYPEVLPNVMWAPPIQELQECWGCQEHMAEQWMRRSDRIAHSKFSRLAKVGIKNQDDPYNPLAMEFISVRVHQGCEFTCSGCNDSWVTNYNYQKHIAPRFAVDNNILCIKCYDNLAALELLKVCRLCDAETAQDMHWSMRNDIDICNNCWNGWYSCDGCGYRVYEREYESHECSHAAVIKNYSYKPRAKFFGNDSYYMGFELEVEMKDALRDEDDYEYHDEDEMENNFGDQLRSRAKYAQDILGDRAYFKSDGSLNCGFEIVTHPHSLLEYQEHFPWEVLEGLSRKRMVSWNTDTCGLHIHVGRVGFDDTNSNARDTHQIRFLKLIYDNERQVTRLAGRSSSYATFSDKGQVIPKIKFGQQRGRYAAVNIENSKTLEVRVFKGSLKKERVLAQLEFVHAAVEYTRNLKVVPKDNPFSWARFIGFVANNNSRYSNLFALINKLFATETAVTGD